MLIETHRDFRYREGQGETRGDSGYLKETERDFGYQERQGET